MRYSLAPLLGVDPARHRQRRLDHDDQRHVGEVDPDHDTRPSVPERTPLGRSCRARRRARRWPSRTTARRARHRRSRHAKASWAAATSAAGSARGGRRRRRRRAVRAVGRNSGSIGSSFTMHLCGRSVDRWGRRRAATSSSRRQRRRDGPSEPIGRPSRSLASSYGTGGSASTSTVMISRHVRVEPAEGGAHVAARLVEQHARGSARRRRRRACRAVRRRRRRTVVQSPPLHRLLAVRVGAGSDGPRCRPWWRANPGSFSGSRMVSSRSARRSQVAAKASSRTSWSKVIMLTDFQTTRSQPFDECSSMPLGVPVDRARNQTRERLFRRELPPIGHAQRL